MSRKNIITLFCSVLFTFCICSLIYAKGWVEVNGEWKYQDMDGSYETEVIKKSGDKKYYLDEEGNMVRDYLLEGYNEAIYYFNDDGEMVSNTWVAVDPQQVSDPIDDGPTVYLYYFGANGKAYKAVNGCVKKTIDGKKYLFDEQGRMLSGWIDENGEMFITQDPDIDPFQEGYIYYAGDETDGVLKEGWYEYLDGSLSEEYYDKESIWFYFNPTSNKKVRYNGDNGNSSSHVREYTNKKINGHTYAFDINGVMLVGWEAEPATNYYAENKLREGQMIKKEWIYAVPPDNLQNNTDHIDEVERWFYAAKNGDMVKSIIKKINGKDYVFDNNGIMKSGLVIIDRNTRNYVATIDIESTDGRDFLVDRIYIDKDTEEEGRYHKESQIIYYFVDEEDNSEYGAKKLGNIKLAFADKDYVFSSEKNSEKEGIKNKDKKYYQHGLQLVPEPIIGLGLVLEGYASPSTTDGGVQDQRLYEEYRAAVFNSTDPVIQSITSAHDNNEYYIKADRSVYDTTASPHWSPFIKVVDKNGKKVKKTNTSKKDNNGNYWIIGDKGEFVKAVSVPIKYSNGVWQFRSEMQTSSSSLRSKTGYIPFGTTDIYGKTVKMEAQTDGSGYDVQLDSQYALNFGWIFD